MATKFHIRVEETIAFLADAAAPTHAATVAEMRDDLRRYADAQVSLCDQLADAEARTAATLIDINAALMAEVKSLQAKLVAASKREMEQVSERDRMWKRCQHLENELNAALYELVPADDDTATTPEDPR